MSLSPRSSPITNDPPPPIQDALLQELYHILKNPLRCEKLRQMGQHNDQKTNGTTADSPRPISLSTTTQQQVILEDTESDTTSETDSFNQKLTSNECGDVVSSGTASPPPTTTNDPSSQLASTPTKTPQFGGESPNTFASLSSTPSRSSLFSAKGHISTSNLISLISQFLIQKNSVQTKYRLKRDAIQMAMELIEVYGVLEMVQKGQLFQESRNTYVKFTRRTIRVVVVGGGFAGRKLLRNLESKLGKFPFQAELILVSSKEYFESLPSIPSLLRDYGNLTRIRASYDRYFKKTRVILQPLERIISDDCIQLADGGLISDIDYLVLCTGSKYDMSLLPGSSNPDTCVVNCADASDVVRNYKKIHEANSIAVIGGGAVGLEMASEIAVKYPEKTLYLVSSRDILLERCCKAAHKNVKNFLSSFKNCHMILGSHVKEVSSTHVYLSDGRQLESEVVLACIGFTPQTETFRDTWDVNAFDKRGQIRINEYFQVENHPTVFAIGDICNIVEEKLAQVAEKHADLLAKNLVRLETCVAMRSYKPKTRPIFVSLGPKHSIFIHGQIVVYEGIVMSFVKHLIEYKMM
eukprot:CAMPEP_0117448402 /NCGR_PEP_ID=MMETSP0759-20121206/7381_1 /TAXON_ID=63605 /ORGANISM="Percolomonas cosmopolitus, Strain WS" /LENGTH=579 /DNA_ID=CAMNT_0005240785 /DNA_START=139 /DNA_END=1875 /DNA_ORIENTATION=-